MFKNLFKPKTPKAEPRVYDELPSMTEHETALWTCEIVRFRNNPDNADTPTPRLEIANRIVTEGAEKRRLDAEAEAAKNAEAVKERMAAQAAYESGDIDTALAWAERMKAERRIRLELQGPRFKRSEWGLGRREETDF